MDKKILVAYFSASGTTAKAAKFVADVANADLFEIKPLEPYTRADLNWNDKSSRSSREMDNPHSRPAILSTVEDMSQYDTIFIGFPIWWGDMPMAMFTLLDTYDLSGKRVIPFCTHGGSGPSKSVDSMAELEPNATIENGFDVKDSKIDSADDSINKWLKELGY